MTATFDVLQRDLNVFDIHFLEASAGTGKTFAIEHYVTRLLLESEQPLNLEHILVVTFTRASTRELKMRIRKTLMRTQAALLQQTPVADYLTAIFEQGEERVNEALKRIESALVCFDSAQIFTLHGFCHRMLTEFAFESKTPFALTSPDEINPSSFYQHAVRECLLHHLSPVDYCPQQLRAVLKAAKNDPVRLVHKIVSLLNNETEITAYPSLQELHNNFLTVISKYPSIQAEAFFADFERLKSCYKLMTKDRWTHQVQTLGQVLCDKTISLEGFGELLTDGESFISYMQKSNLKVRHTFPERSALHYPGLFDLLVEEILPIVDLALHPTKTLMRLARDCQQYAARSLNQEACFSPDKMLRRLQEALDTPEFLQAVRARYRAAIIDEFQDTDPIQWNIFKRVFVGHVEAMCLVGDPKQSIYAFRSADIYTYLAAAAAVGEEKRQSLDTNYRSTSVLIDALNHLFAAPRGTGWLPLPRHRQMLHVPPVRAGSALQADGAHRGALHFSLCSAERGRGTQWPTAETEEKSLFPFIADEILALRARRQLPWDEIVVLVKDRFQAERLLDHFKKHSIPASFRKGTSIADSPALMACRELLLAVLHPSDLSRLKCALGGPLIGWDDQLLQRRLDDPMLQRAKIQMQLLQKTLFKGGFGPFYNQFLATVWPHETRSVGEWLLGRGNFNLYQELRKLAELLIEEELAHQLQGSDFVLCLDEIALQAAEEEARFKIPPQEGKGSVALMTVHLSKGLEFDTVFALALASRHVRKEDSFVKIGADQILVAFDAQDPACTLAMEEVDAEKMRHLYVALTRAKQQVYIPHVIDTSGKPLKTGEASPIELFLAKISDASVDSILSQLGKDAAITYSFLEDEPLEFKGVNTLIPPVLIEPSPLELNVTPEYVVSFSSLAPKHQEIAPILVDRTTVEGAHALPLGAGTGVLVHRLFELIFKRSLHCPLDIKKIEALVDQEVQAASLRPAIIQLLIEHLGLSMAKLRLSDVPSTQMYQELEFLFPIDGGMMKGFADLVFLYQDKYYILDWKTNYLGSSDQAYTRETMEQAMQANHYFLQASIYAAALKRYVKLFDIRPFEEIFGGALYVFVRGKGVLHFFPTPFEDILLPLES